MNTMPRKVTPWEATKAWRANRVRFPSFVV